MPNDHKKSPNKLNPDILAKENEKLKAEIAMLKKQNTRTEKQFNWRGLTKWSSISLAGAIFIVASIVFYIGMTLTNTDRFMNVAGPLAAQPAVQEAVADKTTDALFEKVDVESLSAEVLPDKVDFLAPTVATQIENFVRNETLAIISSDTFQETWNTSVRKAHERLITGLENYEGDGTINLNEVFVAVTQRLEGGKLGFLAGKELPAKVGSITVIQADWLPVAHNFVSNFQTFRVATIGLFIILLALAVWISHNRRKTIMQLASMIASLSIVMLISLRVARNIFLDQVDPIYLQAATEIWSVFTRPFAIQLITTIVVALAVLLVAWLGNNSKTAVGLRRRIESLFSGKLHESIFSHENSLTLWTGKYEKQLLTIIGIGFILSLLIIDLTLGSLLIAGIIAALIALVIVTVSGKK